MNPHRNKQANKQRPLSEKEEKFAQYYVAGDAAGNATAAYLKAFPQAKSWKRASARKAACLMMKNGSIARRISALMNVVAKAQIEAFKRQLRQELGLE